MRSWGIGAICVGTLAANIALMPPRYALRVPAETLERRPLPQIIRAGGTVEPKRSQMIKAEFDAPIKSKLFKEGDTVKQGQLLVMLGRDRIRLEYENKSNALENARADLEKAQKEAAVSKALYRKGAVARSNVEDTARMVVRARQMVKSTEEEFRLQQERWNKDKIYALFDGTIVRDALGGELFITNGKEMATLADISDYSIVARVDELEIRQVREGQSAEVRLQAYADIPISATVTSIGSQAQGDGLPQIPVTLALKPTMGVSLRPNMTGVVRLITGFSPPTLSIPLTAISNADGQSRVWVVKRSGRLEARTVTLGQSNPDRVEITRGLREGERVCSEATSTLAAGQKVRIDNSKKKAPSILKTLEIRSSGPGQGKIPFPAMGLPMGTTGQRPPLSAEEMQRRQEFIKKMREQFEARKQP